MSTLRLLFDVSPSALRRFERSFSATSRARGLEYAARGLVAIAEASQSRLLAHVRGTSTYEVEIETKDSALQARCSCPHFRDSQQACKHLWATLLTARAQGSLPGIAEAQSLELDFLPADRNDGDPLDLEEALGATIAARGHAKEL